MKVNPGNFQAIIISTLEKMRDSYNINIGDKEGGQMFSCEYCEIFKNTYFEEHLRMTASIMMKFKW